MIANSTSRIANSAARSQNSKLSQSGSGAAVEYFQTTTCTWDDPLFPNLNEQRTWRESTSRSEGGGQILSVTRLCAGS